MLDGILFSYETHPRDLGESAIYQVEGLLKNLGEIIPNHEKAILIPRPGGVNGLILLDLRECLRYVDVNEKITIRKNLVEFLVEAFDKGDLLSIVKIRIIDFIVPLDIDKLVDVTRFLADRIRGTWKIELRTRKMADRMEIIRKVASVVDQPVDLKNPKFVLNIEILSRDLVVVYLVDKEREEETIIRPKY